MVNNTNFFEIFGWNSVIRRYAKEWKWDVALPLVVTVILLVSARFANVPSNWLVSESISVGLVVLPVFLSVLVAGYVLLLTIYFSGNIDVFLENDVGKDLLYRISANYAFCIVSAIIGLLLTITISFVFHLNIYVLYPGWINYPACGTIYVFILFTLKNLKDLVIALFDFGQTFIFSKELKGKAEEKKKERTNRWNRWVDSVADFLKV
jgi:hypothetical protein